ncbi:MAG: GxxExxY protein [Ignavibacteria bacterium]|nr:GxxExxY protein [Ignavibacteria bacterium]
MTENEVSYFIRGAIYEVYNGLGAGLFESVYAVALEWELRNKGLDVKREVAVPVEYKDNRMDLGFKLDLLIEDKVIIEVKSVAKLEAVHHKQVLTYLKLTELKLAILVNFNVANINEGIFRKVNGLNLPTQEGS